MTAAISDNLQQRLWSVNRSSTFHRFSYEPLPIASAFRVMELLPGTRQDPVKINILTASWTSHLPYEPISYVWGDATDVQECEFNNNQSLLITKHLHTALVHFRYPDKARIVWADAICINQQDKEEVSNQVQQMKRIYESGTQTLIWLGPDENSHAAAAFSTIRRVGLDILRLSGIKIEQLNNVKDFYVLLQIIAQGSEKVDDSWIETEQWQLLGSLYQLSWFRRLWIIQEFNANSAISFWGKNSESAQLIALVATWICYDPIRGNRFYMELGDGALYASRMAYKLLRSPADNPIEALSALHFASRFATSEPKDRVYALLGLPFLAANITANYNLTTSQVYQDLASAFVIQGHLQVLRYVNKPVENSSAEQWEDGFYKPSWVPRWDPWGRDHIDVPSSVLFKAGIRDLDAKFFRELSQETVTLEGLVIDTIVEASELDLPALGLGLRVPADAREGSPPTALEYSEAWCQVLRQTKHMVSDEEVYDAYERTLSCGILELPANREWIGGYHGGGALANILRTLCQSSWQHPDGIASPQVIKSRTREPFQMDRFMDYIRLLQKERKFLRTGEGYIGTGPCQTKAGDKVVILYGSFLPYVLREHGEGRYLLVGEVYIDGIMHGEALKQHEKGELPSVETQRFVIE